MNTDIVYVDLSKNKNTQPIKVIQTKYHVAINPDAERMCFLDKWSSEHRVFVFPLYTRECLDLDAIPDWNADHSSRYLVQPLYIGENSVDVVMEHFLSQQLNEWIHVETE